MSGAPKKKKRVVVRRPAWLPNDPASVYAWRVSRGIVPAGEWVVLACGRHLRDLRRKVGPRWKWRWEPNRAERVAKMFRGLKHGEGEFEGKSFELAPWQRFVVGSLYGWVGPDGMRRFRRAYVMTGKGSGKSPLVAGLAIWGLLFDGEGGSQCYLFGRTREQGRVTFRYVVGMLERSGMTDHKNGGVRIAGGMKPFNASRRGGFIRLVSGQTAGQGASGPLPSMVIADEYHEHPDDSMLGYYGAGMKHRRQPLTVISTNAPMGEVTPCGMEQARALRVLKQEERDERYFAYLAAVDATDRPFEDEKCWAKANPGLPSVPGREYIRGMVRDAGSGASARARIERLVFGRSTDAVSPWIERETWIRAETGAEEMTSEAERAGWPCYLGLDLSRRHDLTAGAAVWERPDGVLEAEVEFWSPEDGVETRARMDRAPYVDWARTGELRLTPGGEVGYDAVARWLRNLMERNEVVGLAFDAWRFQQMVSELRLLDVECRRTIEGDGLLALPHPQGWSRGTRIVDDAWRASDPEDDDLRLSMPASIDAMESALRAGGLKVRRSAPLRWGMSGVVLVSDAAGNRRPHKGQARTRIDGAVALVMAVGLQDFFRLRREREGQFVFAPPGGAETRQGIVH